MSEAVPSIVPAFIAVMLLIFGADKWLGYARHRKRCKRIQDTPTSPIAAANG